MKTLYLDLGMGAAGDMLAAALIPLVSDPEGFVAELNEAGIPGVRVRLDEMRQKGICGTSFRVFADGIEEGGAEPGGQVEEHEAHHAHEHGEYHAHEHGEYHAHAHRSMAEIRELIEGLRIPETVRRRVLSVYEKIAAAESRVHGTEVSEVHFHEVGMLDAVADITAVCLAMERLGPVRVVASPVHAGYGTVRTAHGVLPVPAPATAELLKGIPYEAGAVEGELCTPTGAALLAAFVEEFRRQPAMRVEAVGCGIGKKEFPVLNAVRAFYGEETGSERQLPEGVEAERILELACNLDDMTAEELAFACGRIAEAGALDVWQIPCGMKKGRMGVQLTALCRPERKDEVLAAIFRHTTTIGVRTHLAERYALTRSRSEADTPFGPVRKKSSGGGAFSKEKWEFEDLARIAVQEDLTLRDVRSRLGS